MTRTAGIIRLGCWAAVFIFCFAALAQWDAKAQPAGAPAAVAGDKPAGAEAPAEEAGKDPEKEAGGTLAGKSLGMLIVGSGWFSMLFYAVLAVFSLVAVMTAIERFMHLRRSRVAPLPLVNGLREMLSHGPVDDQALRDFADPKGAPLARILNAGLSRAGRPLPEVEKAMEDAAARETDEMRGRHYALTVVGNIAPLVGLLGTVVGMIFAFGTASEVGLGRADELAKGIYLALMTTAGGLSIAIPAMLLSAWFNTRVDRFMREIAECMIETMPSFTMMEREHTAAPARAQSAAAASENAAAVDNREVSTAK